MNSDFDLEIFKHLVKYLNYEFKDLNLMKNALIHSSYVNESRNEGCVSNERLEFLGDAILQLVATEYIYLNFPDLDEGEMSKLRSRMVSERTLAYIAQATNLGKYLYMGKGEESTGGRAKESILADTTEALIGAAFLDSDYYKVREIILEGYLEITMNAINGNISYDYKTKLQEVVQSKKGGYASYRLKEALGPDNDKTFLVELIVNGKVVCLGKGKNKKSAEQRCARIALMKMGVEFD